MYTDLLTRIKNAQAVKHETIKVPYSSMDFEILRQLQKYAFIKSAKKLGRLPKRMIEINLNDPEADSAIHGVRFISKPSRMLYRGYRDIRPVRDGYGIAIISTPKGIMTDREVHKLKVGGVYLFEVW